MADYHEPAEELSPEARDIVRALKSLKEEIEAIEWYHQRVVTASDEELHDMLKHNRDEEIEHAVMAIEWLRRRMPEWDEQLREHLYKDGPVASEGGEDEEDDSGPGDLGIGRLQD